MDWSRGNAITGDLPPKIAMRRSADVAVRGRTVRRDALAVTLASIALLLPASVRGTHGQALPAVTAVLAAPGVAPACLPPPVDSSFIPAAPGPTGVLLRGRGFQPAERVLFGLISVTPVPPTTKVVYHDVQPIVEVIADRSGNFACEAYLELDFISAPSYYQIGAFAQSTVELEGTELLPAAVLLVPAMPPTGSGGNLDVVDSKSGSAVFATATILVALAAAGWLFSARDEWRGSGRGGRSGRQP